MEFELKNPSQQQTTQTMKNSFTKPITFHKTLPTFRSEKIIFRICRSEDLHHTISTSKGISESILLSLCVLRLIDGKLKNSELYMHKSHVDNT